MQIQDLYILDFYKVDKNNSRSTLAPQLSRLMKSLSSDQLILAFYIIRDEILGYLRDLFLY